MYLSNMSNGNQNKRAYCTKYIKLSLYIVEKDNLFIKEKEYNDVYKHNDELNNTGET